MFSLSSFNLTLVVTCCTIIVGKNSLQSECGKRLENGAVICVLSKENTYTDPFEFNLCTHGAIMTAFSCANQTCTFSWTEESKLLSKWAQPHLPQKLGLLFPTEIQLYEYLSTPERRSNTVKNMTDWMLNNGMSFVKIVGISAKVAPNKTIISRFNDFVENFANELHKHDFHVGLDITLRGHDLFIPYDLERLSQIVDWFDFITAQATFGGYMQPFTPLTSFNGNETGSTKYWIEKSVRLLKPECLVLDVGPLLQHQTAIESAVEPGPGSRAKLTTVPFSSKISDICYLLLLENTCREFWDEESSTPWAICGNDYYTYENTSSLRLKVELAQQYNITRLVFHTSDINPDNICGDGDALILLKAVQGIRLRSVN